MSEHADIRVRGTGPATAAYGGVAISGVVNGSVNLQPRPVARSAYLRQVQRIAPPALVDRERELAELGQFCTTADAGPYRLLRAGPWAGKSALTSWFVLHPPAEVDIVSFFVTARFAGQSDRVAFTEVVIEQLAELLDEPMPSQLTDATRDQCFLDMLGRASESRRAAGRRLILLVDGLDEDRGVVTGPDAYSIAALLPAAPQAGLRIIVAGRPNPPIPGDVPDGHPLRDQSMVRALAPSPAATVVRADMLRELTRLLRGAPTEQDMLGLLVAAGGGLSAADLSELLDVPAWEVEEHLTTVAGRSFTPRPNRWHPEAPPVYVLGHEEVQVTAVDRIGPARLTAYRRQLHEWADRYRARGWPTETPEYLLRGWFRLLEATQDVPRMVQCATDEARHDRMLDLSGGDTAALMEIDRGRDACVADPAPDLPSLARIAVHRSRLVERNANLPHRLPAVWAALGREARAEALTRSMPTPEFEVDACLNVAYVLMDKGNRAGAVAFVDSAETAARRVVDEEIMPTVIADVIAMSVHVGDSQRAILLAEAARPAEHRVRQMTTVARMVAEYGDQETGLAVAGRAVEAAWRLTEVSERCQALAHLAGALTVCGAVAEARALARSISQLVMTITDPTELAAAWSAACAAHVRAGDPAEAARLLGLAVGAVSSVESTDLRYLIHVAILLRDVDRAEALARTGSHLNEYAEELVDAATESDDAQWALALAGRLARLAPELADPNERAAAFGNAISIMARHGATARASALALEVGTALLTEPPVDGRGARRLSHGVTTFAGAAAGAGHLDLATRLAHLSPDEETRDTTLASVASAAARAGQLDAAESIARSIATAAERRSALLALILVVESQDPDRAALLVADVDDPASQAAAYTTLARRAAADGQDDRGYALAIRAETTARSVLDLDRHLSALGALVKTVRHDGLRAAVRRVVPAVLASPGEARGPRVDAVLDMLSRLGEPEEVARLAAATREEISGTLARRRAFSPARHATYTACVALAECGDVERAEQLLGSIDNRYLRSQAAAVVARALAEAGSLRWAAEVAASITNPHYQAEARLAVADALAIAGAMERARTVVAESPTPYYTAWLSTKLVDSATRADDRSAARDWARLAERAAAEIPQPYWRTRVAASLATAVLAAGESEWGAALTDQAQRLLDQIPDANQALRATAATLHAVAALGDEARFAALARRADDLLLAINEPYARSCGAAALARAFLALGDLDGTERILAPLQEVEGRQDLVTALVRATAVRDGVDAAELKAGLAGDPLLRAGALARAATTCGPELAGPLVARALGGGDWTAAVDALASISPGAIDALAEEYLRVLPGAWASDS
ncbi:hypothetical protein ACQPWW_21310 [Micromonospora sp. CA-240977]|uniref:hypothetical protein n=1 Tax=Micromonospora sp. CA-240977 TaxID=3239957 RepID=UPI003D8E056D